MYRINTDLGVSFQSSDYSDSGRELILHDVAVDSQISGALDGARSESRTHVQYGLLEVLLYGQLMIQTLCACTNV